MKFFFLTLLGIDYEKSIYKDANQARTLNTIKHILSDVSEMKSLFCLVLFSKSDSYIYDAMCMNNIRKEFVKIEEDVHTFGLTHVICHHDKVRDALTGLSKQNWYNGKEKNKEKMRERLKKQAGVLHKYQLELA